MIPITWSMLRDAYGGSNPVRISQFYTDETTGFTYGQVGLPLKGQPFQFRTIASLVKQKHDEYLSLTTPPTTPHISIIGQLSSANVTMRTNELPISAGHNIIVDTNQNILIPMQINNPTYLPTDLQNIDGSNTLLTIPLGNRRLVLVQYNSNGGLIAATDVAPDMTYSGHASADDKLLFLLETTNTASVERVAKNFDGTNSAVTFNRPNAIIRYTQEGAALSTSSVTDYSFSPDLSRPDISMLSFIKHGLYYYFIFSTATFNMDRPLYNLDGTLSDIVLPANPSISQLAIVRYNTSGVVQNIHYMPNSSGKVSLTSAGASLYLMLQHPASTTYNVKNLDGTESGLSYTSSGSTCLIKYNIDGNCVACMGNLFSSITNGAIFSFGSATLQYDDVTNTTWIIGTHMFDDLTTVGTTIAIKNLDGTPSSHTISYADFSIFIASRLLIRYDSVGMCTGYMQNFHSRVTIFLTAIEKGTGNPIVVMTVSNPPSNGSNSGATVETPGTFIVRNLSGAVTQHVSPSYGPSRTSIIMTYNNDGTFKALWSPFRSASTIFYATSCKVHPVTGKLLITGTCSQTATSDTGNHPIYNADNTTTKNAISPYDTNRRTFGLLLTYT